MRMRAPFQKINALWEEKNEAMDSNNVDGDGDRDECCMPLRG